MTVHPDNPQVEDVAISLSVFVDFDGTVTDEDVGNGIFSHFMRLEDTDLDLHEDLISRWKVGQLSSEECLTAECARTVVTPEEFDRELDRYDLTPGFAEFAAFCGAEGIPITILSDGLDYYIARILNRFGLGHIPFRANLLVFTERGIGVEFPHLARGCGRCGNCKRWHISSGRGPDDRVVYVGDGYSDRFAIHEAELVFARRDLANFCAERGIAHHTYDDFFSVLAHLERIHAPA